MLKVFYRNYFNNSLVLILNSIISLTISWLVSISMMFATVKKDNLHNSLCVNMSLVTQNVMT